MNGKYSDETLLLAMDARETLELSDLQLELMADYEHNVLGLRYVSAAERKALAKKGAALPHGGFPMATCGDVANAIHAIGRAKNPIATRALIKKRAAALGCKVGAKWK